MAKRRTMGGALTEELDVISVMGSPLRRKSLAAPMSPMIVGEDQNDDESERLARRRQPDPLDSSRNTENTERRVSLGLTSGLSANEIVENYNKCLKLCAENKITSKNVFVLSMIDYMAVLHKRDHNINNMQTAGTSLDVSTKIYGLRVDCVYLDAFKMAGDPGSENKDKDKKNETLGENQADKTNLEEPQAKPKRKRPVQDIIKSEESLEEEANRINLVPKYNNDTQTTDLLHLVTFPIHANSRHRLHRYNDLIFDLSENLDTEDENINPEIEIDEIEDIENPHICESLAAFYIVGWSEADLQDPPANTNGFGPDVPQDGRTDNEIRFDLDASVMSNNGFEDDYNTGINYFDMNEANQENLDRCGRRLEKGNGGENIVDFCQTITEKNDKTVQNVEYSYAMKSMQQFHWAGPIHWRPKSIGKILGGSRLVGTCRQEGTRKKKEIKLDQTAEFAEDFFYKLDSLMPKRLQNKTLRQAWQENKLILPEDVHYDTANCTKLYLHTMRLKLFIEGNKSNEEMSKNNDPTINEPCQNYDYDNLNDTVDYCSQNDNDVDGVNGDDDAIEGIQNGNQNHIDQNNEGNENHFDDLLTQGLTGENLVALPRSTTQIQIAYSIRAKKIDMRQLKRTLWKALTIQIEKEVAIDGCNNRNSEVSKIQEDRDFSTIYKGLPILLGKDNAQALTPALAFSSLLHLANEKSLEIISTPDLSDLKISQG